MNQTYLHKFIGVKYVLAWTKFETVATCDDQFQTFFSLIVRSHAVLLDIFGGKKVRLIYAYIRYIEIMDSTWVYEYQ